MTEPHPHRFPGVTFAAIAAELARETARRINAFPGMIAKGSMTETEARHQIALFEALAEDCARFAQAHAPLAEGRPIANPLTVPARHAFTWRERRAALLRELAWRRRLYPQWIAKGKLTEAEAARQNRCLEALRQLYEDGFDCPPADWPAIEAELAAERDPATQEEMPL